MNLKDWYDRIQRDIEAWRKYRDIDDVQEKDIKTLERWMELAKQSKPLWLKYRMRIAYYLRLAKSAERKSYTRPTYRPKITHLRGLNTVTSKHFDKPYIKHSELPFLTMCKHPQVKSNRLYARIKMGRYHIDTTGFDFDVKYAKRSMTEYEPKITAYELDHLYPHPVTVRKMRKTWGGVSRVFDATLPAKAIHGERYAHRDLNRIGRTLVTPMEKPKLKEQALRSMSHTLIHAELTLVDSVQLATVEGLKGQYEKAARKEIKRQTSKSSATIDAWAEFADADLSLLTEDVDWSDLKAVLRKFAHLEQDVKEFIGKAWERYHEHALKERLANPSSQAKIMTAEEIENLDDADKGYMNKDY